MKFLLVFVTLFLSVAVNLPDNMLVHLGLHPDYLKVALFAFILTGMIISQRLAMVVLICLLSAGANLPSELLQDYGLQRDTLIATLALMVITPWLYRQFHH